MKHAQMKRGSILVYLAGWVAVVALMLMVKKCSTESIEYNDTKASGDTLNVAIELSPLGISTRHDTLSGFHYDLIRAIAARHGRPLQISAFSTPASAFASLKEGRYDIVISDIPATASMKEELLFTDPIYLDRQVLVRKHIAGADTLFQYSQNSLAGDTVWVAEGSPFVHRIRNLAHEIGDTIYIMDKHGYGAEQLGMLTALGEIKQAVMNREQAAKIKESYPDIDISTPISFNQFQGWVLAPGNEELRDTINSWVNDYKNTPEFITLQRKYNLK